MSQRKSFPLRIEPKLYRELEAWAQQEFRSVNAQIECLLSDAVHKRRLRLSAQPPDAASPSSPEAQR